MSDFNSNARGVVRNCIIWGPIKVDAHGKSTNSPPRSARHWEVYRNSWPGDFGNYRSMELRGGTGRIWGNSSPQSTQGAFMMLTEYGVTGIFNTLYGRFVTPSRYPSDDQIGVGKDPRVGASEPVYLWSNRRAGAIWQIALGADPSSVSYLYATDAAGYPVGTTEITITAPGKWLPAGNYLAVAGDPNRYKVAVEHTTSGPNSTRFVIEAPGLRQAIPAAPTAITARARYRITKGKPEIRRRSSLRPILSCQIAIPTTRWRISTGPPALASAHARRWMPSPQP